MAGIQRHWELRESNPQQALELSSALGLLLPVAGILVGRGLTDPDSAKRFLNPSLADLPDPFLMKGMPEAVARLEQALRDSEKICIYGDYDVDGVTSTSLLLLFLKQLGFEADYYIPSRLKEGYGLNQSSIDEFIRRGVRLLVTVDCGTADGVAIQKARDQGLDVIVMDHHQVGESLPPANALLNPHQADCGFPFKDLAAVGVVFHLVVALRAALREKGWFAERPEPNLREYLDLVGLGTIADIVPLLSVNRIVTRFGLEELRVARRPGIAALKEVAGMHGGSVSIGQVGFRLAPRMNAVGRLGQAHLAVELLTTNSYSRALQLARELEKANAQRQGIESEIFEEASRQAERWMEGKPPGLVLESDKWHVGVIGIVASRLMERFRCPVVLIALDGEVGRGSARTTEDVHLYETLHLCGHLLEGYGGHRAAAGLTIRREKVEEFRRVFLQTVERTRAQDGTGRRLWLDACLPPGVWDVSAIQQLQSLAPFGMGNPEPVFLGERMEVKSARVVGKEPPYHVRASLVDGERVFSAIAFRQGDRIETFSGRVDIAYVPELNDWDGSNSLQLRIVDIRYAH